MGHDHSARRRRRPIVESLEGRRLPSPAMSPPASDAPMGLLQDSGPPVLKRATLAAAFSGRYTIGTSRIEGQALQTYLVGGGTSNAFLHGDFQLAFATPVDPTEPAAGIATLVPNNHFTTGSELVLELEAAGATDPRGRTRSFTWTVSDSSSGAFQGTTGQGTLEIRFLPGGRGPRPALESGRVSTMFRGEVEGPDTSNPIRLR